MPPPSLPIRHLLLALVVVAIWGANFVAIKLALHDMPPLLLCAVRFIFVAIPAVFFLKRPRVPLRLLLLYGLTMFGFQFGFLFLGMHLGISPGLASLVIQAQVFVTLGLAALVLRERISWLQITGALVAFCGFGVVAIHAGEEVTAVGFACVLLAALSWGTANFTSKKIGRVNALALVVWGGLVVPIPMLIASVVFEGPALILASLTQIGTSAILGLAFIVYASTLIAYSLWSWLLARHPASTVTPFALLVPVFGMLSSALVLGETLPAWKLQAAALVIAGLAVNIFGPHLRRWLPIVRPT